MPTGEGVPDPRAYSQGEMQRTLTRIEQTVGALAGSVVTKNELELHMKGLIQQFKVIDDRHNALAKDLQDEKTSRANTEREREKEQRGFRRSVILCIVAAAAAVLLPLLSRGVGLS